MFVLIYVLMCCDASARRQSQWSARLTTRRWVLDARIRADPVEVQEALVARRHVVGEALPFIVGQHGELVPLIVVVLVPVLPLVRVEPAGAEAASPSIA